MNPSNELTTGRGWLLAVPLFVVSSLLLHFSGLFALDSPRPAPVDVQQRHDAIISGNDTDEYCEHLELATAALRGGQVYFPVGDFECPVTFLFPSATLQLVTGWPSVRVLNVFAITVTGLIGLAAFGFFRVIGAMFPVAIVAALGFQSMNFVAYSHHMGHMNNIQVFWVPLAFAALFRLLQPGSTWRPAVGLGLAMGGQILTSGTFTLYLGYVALPTFAAGYFAERYANGEPIRADVGRFLLRGMLAVVVAGFVASFFLMQRFGVPSMVHVVPTWPPFVVVHHLEFLDAAHPVLFVGLPLILLTAIAGSWWWRNRAPHTTAMVGTAVVSLVMMLPALPGSPYWMLYHTLPFLDRVRVPTRFFPMFFLMLLALNAVYLSNCTNPEKPRTKWLAAGVLFAVLLIGNWTVSPWLMEIDVAALAPHLFQYE